MDKDEQLLAEIEDLIRSTPKFEASQYKRLDDMSWPGRVSAAIRAWNLAEKITADSCISELCMSRSNDAFSGFSRLRMLLYEARDDLKRRVGVPMSVVVEKGMRFDYFDRIRKILEEAHAEILIVDPYLDSNFVSRYLTQIKNSVVVRLLTSSTKETSLMPAIELLTQQTGLQIDVRFNNDLHDRYIFIDRRECYQSGASFKDGAVNAMTTVTQIREVFTQVFQAYEYLWEDSKV